MDQGRPIASATVVRHPSARPTAGPSESLGRPFLSPLHKAIRGVNRTSCPPLWFMSVDQRRSWSPRRNRITRRSGTADANWTPGSESRLRATLLVDDEVDGGSTAQRVCTLAERPSLGPYEAPIFPDISCGGIPFLSTCLSPSKSETALWPAFLRSGLQPFHIFAKDTSPEWHLVEGPTSAAMTRRRNDRPRLPQGLIQIASPLQVHGGRDWVAMSLLSWRVNVNTGVHCCIMCRFPPRLRCHVMRRPGKSGVCLETTGYLNRYLAGVDAYRSSKYPGACPGGIFQCSGGWGRNQPISKFFQINPPGMFEIYYQPG